MQIPGLEVTRSNLDCPLPIIQATYSLCCDRNTGYNLVSRLRTALLVITYGYHPLQRTTKTECARIPIQNNFLHLHYVPDLVDPN